MSKNREVFVDFSEPSCCSPDSDVRHCCDVNLFFNHIFNKYSHTAAMEASLDPRRLGAA
jgi:hypothetical protein